METLDHALRILSIVSAVSFALTAFFVATSNKRSEKMNRIIVNILSAVFGTSLSATLAVFWAKSNDFFLLPEAVHAVGVAMGIGYAVFITSAAIGDMLEMKYLQSIRGNPFPPPEPSSLFFAKCATQIAISIANGLGVFLLILLV